MLFVPHFARKALAALLCPFLLVGIFVSTAAYAVEETPATTDGAEAAKVAPQPSHRLIIELDGPPLATAFHQQQVSAASNGTVQSSRLTMDSSFAQSYVAQLQAQQQAFINSMLTALPNAQVSTFINELGVREQATYQVVFNGISVDPGSMERDAARARLARMDGVKAVYDDMPYVTQLYTSTALINAPTLWNSPEIGGIENAGAGIKIASMDGGVHKDAPMMNGAGYEYPTGFGPAGLGLTANNNGKIIASRVYFRPWDPPAVGDENPWPGENGTSHGIHTASTAAGDVVQSAEYVGFDVGTMSGVAPKAYVMSYRVFYESITENASFYTTEGIAALEDIVRDGADVVNNSWGSGPFSSGGQFDALDTALLNANKAGVFVSMSAGNAGPGLGTSDHPSGDYMNVAASTTSGTLAAGRINIVGSTDLEDLPYTTASFGPSLEIGEVATYDILPAIAVDAANATGCDPFPADAFAGKAALISRGACNFSDKAYNAQQAGAILTVIHNNRDGDSILGMSCGSYCGEGEITIASVMISENNGLALLDLIANAGSATLELDTLGFQSGSDADVIASFSSRGPGVGNVLKPDITAPGVNILANGYTDSAEGEARHLGYGQASGTSMAAPHVAGAAALLKQLYPNWSNAAIKSALMSTAKYMEVYTGDGTPAQPLDMGAGRLDVAAAMDPGVILDPPSLSFGKVISGSAKTIAVQVTSVSDSIETYNLSTLSYTDFFTDTSDMAGITISPSSLTLAAGNSATVEVTYDSTTGTGLGDNQGFLLMEGTTHNAHMPAWARVAHATSLADVLIIDNDSSSSLGSRDYLWYYTSTLEQLGYTYEVIDADANFGNATTIPDAITLDAYKAVIYYTGDNFEPDGTYGVSTSVTALDMDRLVEYLNDGGSVIAMGQDMAAVMGAAETDGDNLPNLYSFFGANWIQDSLTNSQQPDQLIVSSSEAPVAFQNVKVDLTQPRVFAGEVALSGENSVPPVDTPMSGSFGFEYDVDQQIMQYNVSLVISPTTPFTLTNAHIHTGTVGATGGVIVGIYDNVITSTTFITDTFAWEGEVPIANPGEITAMLSNGLYVNIHTSATPSGEIRGQIEPSQADIQFYIDEIDNEKHDGGQDPTGTDIMSSVELLRYAGPNAIYEGTVAMANRDQPSLENPGTTYNGRSIYTTFGLEGVSNDNTETISRTALLDLMLDWSWSEPSTVTISETFAANSELYIFTADLADAEGASYRWDYGDGSEFVGPLEVSQTGHTYTACGAHVVRAEVTDALGNVSIGSHELAIKENCTLSLSISMSTTAASAVAPGEAVAVLLAYENTGASPISTVLEMVVPNGTISDDNSDAGWSCATDSPAGTACELPINELAAGASDSALFKVIVDAQPSFGGTDIVFASATPQSAGGPVTLAEASPDMMISVLAPASLDTIAEPLMAEPLIIESQLERRTFLPVINQ